MHGSDAEDTARFELSYFFAGYELATIEVRFSVLGEVENRRYDN